MIQEETLDYNKRCAEFLDIVTEEPHWVEFNKFMPNSITMSYGRRHHIEQLQFHSDWNWIMEVVEAIENLSEHYTTSIHSDVFDKGDEHKMFIFNNKGEIIVGENGKTKKEAVVQAVNQFLIWYEQNKTK